MEGSLEFYWFFNLWSINLHVDCLPSCARFQASVTGEFYTKKENCPRFAQPFVYNAEIMLRFVVIFKLLSWSCSRRILIYLLQTIVIFLKEN